MESVITWTLDKNNGSEQVNQKQLLNAFFKYDEYP